MEMGEMEMQARKRWRLGNGREEAKIDDDDEDGEGVAGSAGVEKEDDKARVLAAWHSSRIFRVSRATGGKDRHSKVLTAKGLRDRRVRLSVSTAIQFYDLQDRLGYDQPSKAVEWLIKAAADAIAELPSLDGAFPTSPNQLRCIERRFQETGKETDFPFLQQQQQHQLQLPHQHQHQQQQQLASLSKSACSSTSETSKGSSGLSLSRSEIRVKARERARKRTAKEKEKEKETNLPQQQHNPNPNSETSFTELLSGCNGGGTANQNPDAHFIPKQFRHFPSMDYFAPSTQLASSGFSSQIHFGNPPVSTLPLGVSAVNAGDQPELQQFTFLQDHFTGSDQTLNFSISSSLAGFNRGTLQSNSPSSPLLPHLQRFSSPVGEGSPNVPFFLGTAAATAALESQFSAGSDGRLQLYYGDGRRHSDRKGKGKS